RPVLSTQCAEALWMAGELEASEARLRDTERWLDSTREIGALSEGIVDGMVVLDQEQLLNLPAKIAYIRTLNAQSLGDVQSTVKHAELALNLTPEEDIIGRARVTVTLGFAYWASGDLEAAGEAIADWISSVQKEGNITFAIAGASALGDILSAQGRLREAARAYNEPLKHTSQQDGQVKWFLALLYLGLAMLFHEMGDQEAADQHLRKSKELGEHSTLVDWPYRWHVGEATFSQSRGDLEASFELLDEAKRLYVRNLIPDFRPIEALKARVYVRQGRLAEALAWARDRGLSVDDDLSYLHEFEHITLARILIARYKIDRVDGSFHGATVLLARLLNAAEEGRRIGSVIEILVLQAIAHEAHGDTSAALVSLERALTLAEPEGFVRIFVDEGPPMEVLLRDAAKRGATTNYTNKLQAAFGKAEGARPVEQPLIEPLSEREIEVLRLLGTELSGPDIARELHVSLHTIRTHTQHIYSKLGVHNRRAAIRRAKELDLL
ncbi:MAG: hypothetical protein JSV68_01635, partial [Anaerolineaceae bacterium]